MECDFSVLRDLRKRRGLTVEGLSKLSGVSYVVLSKLERNRGNPGLKTLSAIATALGMATHNLLALAEQQEPFTALARVYKMPGNGECRAIELDGVRVLVMRTAKGAVANEPVPPRDDHARCLVLEGCVKLTVRDRDYVLKAGDGLMWDAVLDHRCEATEPSVFVKILSPKRP
jgi:transcriptional regulator with XRE-family HTH domain